MTQREKPLFPPLPERLRRDLEHIAPSVHRDMTYWPCAARMKDGRVLTCVYVVPEEPYIRHWGVYPQHDRAKSYILLQDVDAFAESPWRLPARFANEVYQKGETHMGGTVFTVVFADGHQQAYLSGNAVDFIRLPEGLTGKDIVAVQPLKGRAGSSAPVYYWCLFSGEFPRL